VSRAWHDLSGKVAVVIGASRGLGREAALALAGAGADIACCARGDEGRQETARAVEALGRRALDVPLDVEQPDGVDAAFAQIARELGTVDVLVSAAGLMHAAPALKTTLAEWERLIRVNLTGAFTAACAAARLMQERGGRIILFGTSFVGPVLPMTVAYGAGKAGLHQLAKSLALEWARFRITVNVVAPGYFETEMPQAVLGDPELRARVLARIPLRRVGRPSEIGPLVTYLASEASAFMTGAVLRIDGGQALHVS
jgi:NAD(P)-dependent dehydrogenase (short-subunit alcohol dehydrogenase family)